MPGSSNQSTGIANKHSDDVNRNCVVKSLCDADLNVDITKANNLSDRVFGATHLISTIQSLSPEVFTSLTDHILKNSTEESKLTMDTSTQTDYFGIQEDRKSQHSQSEVSKNSESPHPPHEYMKQNVPFNPPMPNQEHPEIVSRNYLPEQFTAINPILTQSPSKTGDYV